MDPNSDSPRDLDAIPPGKTLISTKDHPLPSLAAMIEKLHQCGLVDERTAFFGQSYEDTAPLPDAHQTTLPFFEEE